MFRGLKILVMVLVAAVLFGFVTMHLWNWLMPGLFGLRLITFWQALGLVLLCKILFGGFHKHGGRGWKRGGRDWGGRRAEWKQRMEAKFAGMSEEERQRFREGMRGRWGCGPRRGDEGGRGEKGTV